MLYRRTWYSVFICKKIQFHFRINKVAIFYKIICQQALLLIFFSISFYPLFETLNIWQETSHMISLFLRKKINLIFEEKWWRLTSNTYVFAFLYFHFHILCMKYPHAVLIKTANKYLDMFVLKDTNISYWKKTVEEKYQILLCQLFAIFVMIFHNSQKC